MKPISRRKTQSGLSLVEVLIAMLIGLILMSGVVQVFLSARQSNRVHEATARMQETGRMALEVISRDVRMADFWGCAADITNVVNNLDSAGSGFVDYQTGGLAGTEGGSGASDTLVLRGGVNSGLQVQPPYGPQASANIKVNADNGLSQGDIVMVSDCQNADIFQITNANPDGSGTVVHNTGNAVSPGNYKASNPGCPGGGNAHCLSKVYGADAFLFGVSQISYFIGTGSEGEPALFRNGEEYLDGVEELQVLYGEDTTGSGTANYFVPANQVVDMEQVVSLRFAVVARSYDDNLTGGINQSYSVLGENRTAADERLRQVYTSTVNLRNRL